MLEFGLNGDALEVIAGVVAEDDQDVEAWYLEGWCLWGMAERVKAGEKLGGGEKGKEKQEVSDEELGWEELARDARDCLETCKMLHIGQEHADKPMLIHVEELLAQLDQLGIKPSSERGDENDDEEWVDEDDDVEMS
ncbi:unnamed protein product [Rhizoctonia solani]|nr:unnamed protein product [Rhizoctonia solani]